MGKFADYLQERVEDDAGNEEIPRNSFSLQNPSFKSQKNMSHYGSGNHAKVYQNQQTKKLYVLLSPPEMSGGEWWVGASTVEIKNGKLIYGNKENVVLLDLTHYDTRQLPSSPE
jgi:hypothetical protein